jgi:hypothetical protein
MHGFEVIQQRGEFGRCILLLADDPQRPEEVQRSSVCRRSSPAELDDPLAEVADRLLRVGLTAALLELQTDGGQIGNGRAGEGELLLLPSSGCHCLLGAELLLIVEAESRLRIGWCGLKGQHSCMQRLE